MASIDGSVIEPDEDIDVQQEFEKAVEMQRQFRRPVRPFRLEGRQISRPTDKCHRTQRALRMRKSPGQLQNTGQVRMAQQQTISDTEWIGLLFGEDVDRPVAIAPRTTPLPDPRLEESIGENSEHEDETAGNKADGEIVLDDQEQTPSRLPHRCCGRSFDNHETIRDSSASSLTSTRSPARTKEP